MNWVDGLLADSAEIIDQEGLLPKGYYEHVRLQDDSQKKFITNFTKPEEIMAKRRPDKKLDFQGISFLEHIPSNILFISL